MGSHSGSFAELLAPDYIKRFQPYIPSKPDAELCKLFGCRSIYRMNNNENPLGPPPQSAKILKTIDPHIASLYPSGDSFYLRCKLAESFGIDTEQLLFGNGANEVISFVIKAFCESGDNIVTADKTFAVYEWIAQFSGIEARLVPLRDLGFDDAGIIKAIDKRTKIIFICNPNNPTGTYWDKGRLRRFLEVVGQGHIVVVDEAYFEFVEAEEYPNAIEMIRQFPNLISFRTFSKMYGLAGLRIGYLASSLEVVNVIRRACVVYSVNSIAQECALAAVDDIKHLIDTRAHLRVERDYLLGELSNMGLQSQAGEGCFIMVRMPISDTLAYRRLMTRGVMIRSMTGFRFPNWIRVSIGTHEANEAFIKALREIM